VNNNFQITGSDPTKTGGATQPLKKNMFAFGDCALTSLKEEKNIPAMRFLASILIGNIIALAEGKRLSQSIPRVLSFICIVSMGPTFGIQVVNGMV